MSEKRFESGAFVFTRARGVEPRTPEELAPLMSHFGLESDLVPDYAGDRAVVGRAFTAAKAGLNKERRLLRPIKRTSTELVFGVVKETSDVVDQRLDHEFEAVVSWSAEPAPATIQGDHPVAQAVATHYRHLRGKVTADDWSGAITRFLEQQDAIRVRGDGRVFWVPPQRIENVRRFAAFLAEIGIDLVLCQVESEVRQVAQQIASESLDDQIAHLRSEVAAFDGTQRPSTYARRLRKFQSLRERAILYRDALGVGVQETEALLGELEAKVNSMLDLRTSGAQNDRP